MAIVLFPAGGLTVPDSNSGSDLIVQSPVGGDVTVATSNSLIGDADNIAITGGNGAGALGLGGSITETAGQDTGGSLGASLQMDGGGVSSGPDTGGDAILQAGNGVIDGGGAQVRGGNGAGGIGGGVFTSGGSGGSGAFGASVAVEGGDGTIVGQGGHIAIDGGDSVAGAGGPVSVTAGNTSKAGSQGGDVELLVGAGLLAANTGKLKVGSSGGFGIAAANNGQIVTYGAALGPGGAAISIKRWIPIMVDGNAGWIPHFGV